MKFDCVVMNPPYQDSNNKRSPLWQKFLENSFEWVKKNGYICSVNPCAYRKPSHKLFKTLQNFNVIYIEIHGNNDGMKTFGCGTRYDWLLVNKSDNKNSTEIVFEDGEKTIVDLTKLPFIPHVFEKSLKACIETGPKLSIIHSFSMYENRSPWMSKEKTEINIIHSRTMYGNDKNWMSKEKTDKNIYPCVYSTPCGKPPVMMYSSKKDGHFGIKKVILGKASPENGFYDKDGEYGVMNNCFAIEVQDDEEANNILNTFRSEKFKEEILKRCVWAGFAFEYKVLECFKKDFWKEFI